MADVTLYTGSVLFAIIGGTAAGILSLLCWNILRETPFGTIIALLSVTLSGVIFYHVLLFVADVETVFLDVLRSSMQTAVAVVLWLAILTHRRIQRSASRR